jgi:proteic killer suppression protein
MLVLPLSLVTLVVSIRRVIRSFSDGDTQTIWELCRPKEISKELAKAARWKMQLLDAAESINDLRVPPGNRLEKLQPPRAGQHSIRVNDQYRICFRWSKGGADDIEMVD